MVLALGVIIQWAYHQEFIAERYLNKASRKLISGLVESIDCGVISTAKLIFSKEAKELLDERLKESGEEEEASVNYMAFSRNLADWENHPILLVTSLDQIPDGEEWIDLGLESDWTFLGPVN